MSTHLKVLWNLVLIHRGLRGVASAYRGWRAGTVLVWSLDGQIVRGVA